METTLYTALISANDGIHVFHKFISDPAAEYEDFELFCQNKTVELDGDLFGPYGADDVVENLTLPDGACTPGSEPVAYTDQPYTAEEDADLDRIIRDARKTVGLE